MTFLKTKFIKDKAHYINALKTISVVLLAFIAAVFFRRSAGVLATFPIAFALCAVSAFINVNPKIKLAVFGVTVFALNTVENTDTRVSLTFTALCLLGCLLFQLSARVISKRRAVGVCVMAVCFALCIALSFVFVGNPLSAIKANRVLNGYIESNYPTAENSESTEYIFTKTYYNYNTKAFEKQGYGSDSPTEIGTVSANGETVNDSLKSIVQKNLAQPYVLEITEVLRKRFPDDTFSVSFDEIYRENGKQVISAERNGLYGRIVFEINLGGVQTANKMAEKVKQYTEVLDNANINYGKIIYKSGISPWVKRSATVDKNRPMGQCVFTVYHVPISTSNRFNRFAKWDFQFK
ncbi:MAG: hypothetical protein E7586_03160 [Ruminococcaceae bacterium]|nr:hypothetical protein [Oscillospiraceae bacterium]